MENEKPKKNNEDFYAVVSALARFIETADDDLAAVPLQTSKDYLEK
jgi:hypothetical protein